MQTQTIVAAIRQNAASFRTNNGGALVRRRYGQEAFTLIEMLLVVVIIGVLAAIVIPKIAGRGEDARIQATRAQITGFGTALDMFEVDNGYYPKGKDGLRDLLQAPRDAQNWKGPYLKDVIEVPLDPWSHPYIYECPGKHNTSGYEISSAGPDGRAGNEDDIASWMSAGAKK